MIYKITVVESVARQVYGNRVEDLSFLAPFGNSHADFLKDYIIDLADRTIPFKERYELTGIQEFLFLVIPSYQCLGTLDLLSLYIELGLKVNDEFIVFDGGIKICFDVIAPQDIVMHLVSENRDLGLVVLNA